MNASSASRRPIAQPTDFTAHATALVPVSLDTRTAANDDTSEPLTNVERTGAYGAVNPLWMITAALALFLGVMAILVSS